MHVLVLLCLLFSSSFQFSEWWQNTNTLELGDNNFNQQISKDDYTIVKFYTKWCKYCKQLAPIYEELVEEVKKYENQNIKIKVARVEAEANQSLAFMYGIYSFPQIVLFQSSRALAKFEGNREKTFLLFWLRKNFPYMRRNKSVVKEKSIFDNKEESFSSNEAKVSLPHFDLSKDEIENLNNQLNRIEKHISDIDTTMQVIINQENASIDSKMKIIVYIIVGSVLLCLMYAFLQMKRRTKPSLHTN